MVEGRKTKGGRERLAGPMRKEEVGFGLERWRRRKKALLFIWNCRKLNSN